MSKQSSKLKMSAEDKKFVRELFWWNNLSDNCYNYQLQGGLGYALTVWPAIRKFYKTKEERAEALTRNLMTPYNDPVQMHTLVTGVCSAMEEEASKNPAFDKNIITNMKVGLMGPVSAIGDSFFWGTFRLIASAIGIALCAQGNWIGVLLFILINNVPRLLSTYWCGAFSYKMGMNMLTDIKSSGIIEKLSKVASIVGVTIIGAMTAMMVSLNLGISWQIGEQAYTLQQYIDDIFPSLLPLLATFGIYGLLKKKVNMLVVMLIILAVSVLGTVVGIF